MTMYISGFIVSQNKELPITRKYVVMYETCRESITNWIGGILRGTDFEHWQITKGAIRIFPVKHERYKQVMRLLREELGGKYTNLVKYAPFNNSTFVAPDIFLRQPYFISLLVYLLRENINKDDMLDIIELYKEIPSGYYGMADGIFTAHQSRKNKERFKEYLPKGVKLPRIWT